MSPDTPQPVADRSTESSPSDPAAIAKTEIGSLADQTSPTIPPSQAVPSSGTLVLNPDAGTMIGVYRLDQKLGEGGMGAVWKALHTKLDKHVALKLLPAHFTRDPSLLARFEREMKAVGKLTHPNIIAAHDAGEFQGLHYLVMEYADGVDLGKFVKERGPQPVRNACEMIRQAALGLAHAHQHGMVHRDIKPGNLFLTKSGQVKLLDLGLARLQGDVNGDPVTASGQILGTPDYMAPEQWENTHAVDHRVDMYALGCTLFFLLTGRAPFGDTAHSTFARKLAGHVSESPPDLRKERNDVTTEVNAVYRKLLAKLPEERFSTANELAQTLLTIVKGLVTSDPGKSAEAKPQNAAATVAPTQSLASAKARPQGTSKADAKKKSADDQTHDTELDADVQGLASAPPRIAGRKTAAAGKSGKPTRSGVSSKAWIAGGVLVVAVLLIGMIMKITGKDPTTAAINIPEGGAAEIVQSDNGKSAEAKTGWQGWPADAPKPAIAPFDAEQAKRHQEAWATYLKVPVEHTNSIGMKFVLIPPGEFTMGSTPEEIEETLKVAGDDKHWQECIKSEAPQHKVTLTQPIYLGVNEVTQAEYEKVMGKNPSFFAKTGAEKPHVEDVEGLDTSGHPVEGVRWNDAADFCSKLSQQEKLKPFYFRAGDTIAPLDGTGYRLPTEAEWEFSCRAGTTTKFWIGESENDLLKAGWFDHNSGGRTHAAGELKANPLGLFDIHGNVWEWVQDAWDARWYGRFQEKPAINPSSPFSDGSRRVLRGGVWDRAASRCRSSNRIAFDPSSRYSSVGFRVSLSAVGSRARR